MKLDFYHLSLDPESYCDDTEFKHRKIKVTNGFYTSIFHLYDTCIYSPSILVLYFYVNTNLDILSNV